MENQLPMIWNSMQLSNKQIESSIKTGWPCLERLGYSHTILLESFMYDTQECTYIIAHVNINVYDVAVISANDILAPASIGNKKSTLFILSASWWWPDKPSMIVSGQSTRHCVCVCTLAVLTRWVASECRRQLSRRQLSRRQYSAVAAQSCVGAHIDSSINIMLLQEQSMRQSAPFTPLPIQPVQQASLLEWVAVCLREYISL